MSRLPSLALLLLVALAGQSTAQTASPLVGTWQLVSRIDRDPKGGVVSETSLGDAPLGYLIYDAAGHVAAQLAARDRPATVCDTVLGPVEANNNANISGYTAYFGRYQVDTTAGIVIHQLEGALAPRDAGRRLSRRFQVIGDTLTIQFEPGGSADTRRTRTLIWRRVSS
jgi:catechol 1,2-dioxygenase